MEKKGPLYCKYIIEQNEDLQKKTINMNKIDFRCQWLMGDKLKQDQFRFIYECMKIVYDSALKDKFLCDDKVIIERTIPRIVAFKALMRIRNI